jgi:hypothetical protein
MVGLFIRMFVISSQHSASSGPFARVVPVPKNSICKEGRALPYRMYWWLLHQLIGFLYFTMTLVSLDQYLLLRLHTTISSSLYFLFIDCFSSLVLPCVISSISVSVSQTDIFFISSFFWKYLPDPLRLVGMALIIISDR